MSTMQEDLVTALAAVAGGRIYPLTAPQNAAYPYAIYQRISSSVVNVLAGNGNPPINSTRVQIDVWDKTYAGADATAKAVAAAMLAWNKQNVQLSSGDLFDDVLKVYRVTMDFSIWHYN